MMTQPTETVTRSAAGKPANGFLLMYVLLWFLAVTLSVVTKLFGDDFSYAKHQLVAHLVLLFSGAGVIFFGLWGLDRLSARAKQ